MFHFENSFYKFIELCFISNNSFYKFIELCFISKIVKDLKETMRHMFVCFADLASDLGQTHCVNEEFIFNVLTKKRNLERAVLAIESRSAAARLSAKKKRDEACEDAAKVDDKPKLPTDDDDDDDDVPLGQFKSPTKGKVATPAKASPPPGGALNPGSALKPGSAAKPESNAKKPPPARAARAVGKTGGGAAAAAKLAVAAAAADAKLAAAAAAAKIAEDAKVAGSAEALTDLGLADDEDAATAHAAAKDVATADAAAKDAATADAAAAKRPGKTAAAKAASDAGAASAQLPPATCSLIHSTGLCPLPEHEFLLFDLSPDPSKDPAEEAAKDVAEEAAKLVPADSQAVTEEPEQSSAGKAISAFKRAMLFKAADEARMKKLQLETEKYSNPFPRMPYTLVMADVNYGLNKAGSHEDGPEFVWTREDFENFYRNVTDANASPDFVCIVFCHDNQVEVNTLLCFFHTWLCNRPNICLL